MQRKIAHRIVGVLVIIALAIISLPLLLNKHTSTPVQVAVKTPPFPSAKITPEETDADAVTVDPDSELQTSADKVSDTEEVTVASTTNDQETEAAQALDKPPAEHLKWAVLIGSFKDKNNAQRITDALRVSGYKAFTVGAKNSGMTRVYVGPEFKQVAATSLASKIEQQMKVHGTVVTYKPLEL
jgi:DedD protein